MTDTIKKVAPSCVVVGAGLAGLAAAYRLSKQGWQVTVLEANHYPGGRAASIKKQGYLIDTGATGVGDCYTDYLELIDELGLSDQVVESSTINGTIRDGKIYELDSARPMINGLLSPLLSWRSKLVIPKMFLDLKGMGDKMNFQDVSIGHEYDNETAERYSLRRLNQEILDYFVDPILRALVVARAKYVSKLELMNALNGLFSTKLIATQGGIERLPQTIANQLKVHYETTAMSVTEVDNGVQVRYRDDTGEQRLDADTCVLATLLPQAAAIYPPCEPDVKPMNDELHYIPGICVHLGYSQRTLSKALMVLVPSKEIPDITLIWHDHNKCDDRAPDGHSLIYLYYDDAVADQAALRSDDSLISQCQEIVEQYYPELAGHRDMSHVTRWDAAVPMPSQGIYRKMHEVRNNLDQKKHRRVQLAGDYLSCVGQNSAVVYGNLAADNLQQHFKA